MNHVFISDVAILASLFTPNTDDEDDHFTFIHQAEILQALANLENIVEQVGFISPTWQKGAVDIVYEFSSIILSYIAEHNGRDISFRVGQLKHVAPVQFENKILLLSEFVNAPQTQEYVQHYESELRDAAFEFTRDFFSSKYSYTYALMTRIHNALMVNVSTDYAFISSLFAQVSSQLLRRRAPELGRERYPLGSHERVPSFTG